MDLENDLFLFKFENEIDKGRVLDGAPWTFDKLLLMLQEFNGDSWPEEYVFKYVPFWIRVYDLPLGLRNKHMGERIVQSLGKLVAVDIDNASFLRIRAEIDVNKPVWGRLDLFWKITDVLLLLWPHRRWLWALWWGWWSNWRPRQIPVRGLDAVLPIEEGCAILWPEIELQFKDGSFPCKAQRKHYRRQQGRTESDAGERVGEKHFHQRGSYILLIFIILRFLSFYCALFI